MINKNSWDAFFNTEIILIYTCENFNSDVCVIFFWFEISLYAAFFGLLGNVATFGEFEKVM